MQIDYRFDCQNLTAPDLENLFSATELRGRSGDKIRRAFMKSHVCLAYDGSTLIGASRAISDGEYHGFIYDVAVLPDYQRHGIGRTMIEALLARLPVWRVMLVADDEVQGFYAKCGFESHPNVMARFDQGRLYDESGAI